MGFAPSKGCQRADNDEPAPVDGNVDCCGSMRHGRHLLCVLAVGIASLVLAPAAGATIFWTNQNTVSQGFDVLGSVGSADNDGTGVSQDLVPYQDNPCAVATDGQHVYWATRKGTIGRANADGTDANSNFITGIQFSCGQIAVDSDHVYWTQQTRTSPAIGRADIDGHNVDPQWLPLTGVPLGMAVDSDHVYWTWRPDSSSSNIARANIDGSGVQDAFVHVNSQKPFFLAVDPAHIYAAPLLGPDILRANIEGTHVDQSFIDVPSQAPSCGIAVDDSHIYWGAFGKRGNTVARANIDGTGVNPSFIAGGRNTCGVAVGPNRGPATGFTLGKVDRNERRGTAVLSASVSEPGKLLLSGKGLWTKIRSPLRPRDVRFWIQPRGHKRRVLNRTGKVKVRARVTFHPQCGCREVKRRTIVLVRARSAGLP